MGRRIIEVPTISVDTPHYEQATRWLADNGIDPLEVPMDSEIAVDEATITYVRFPRDENGAYVIAEGKERLVRETATVAKHSSPETYGL